MFTIYNPETNEYGRYVPLDKLDELQADLTKLKERLKQTPVKEPFTIPNELDDVVEINKVDDVKRLLDANSELNIDAPVNRRYASFLLVVAYFGNNLDVIKYLVEEKSASVHRVDAFGYNAIMSIILNDNMATETKIEAIEYFISKGCDVNWLNSVRETALLLALYRMDIEIANFLLDKGAVIFKEG